MGGPFAVNGECLRQRVACAFPASMVNPLGFSLEVFHESLRGLE